VSGNIQLDLLYAELDGKRRTEGKSWRDVAQELAISPSTFTRLAQGRRPDLETFGKMVDWLGVSADHFFSSSARGADNEDTLAVISSYLRADRALRPESADAIETIMRTAYEQLVDKKVSEA